MLLKVSEEPIKRPLLGMKLDELAEMLGSPVRARAAARWLFGGTVAPEALPQSIPEVSHKAWRAVLERCELRQPKVSARHASEDGTVKYGLDVGEGAAIETVLIPAEGRSTVCVSSQVGCTRHCAFCATARLGYRRSLRADEIIGQFLLARKEAPPEAPLRNVVFMGMGEPMDNLDEVLRAVEILTQRPAPQLASGHVTVSTSGVLPGIRRFLSSCGANLALSLNGSSDAQRERLMPQTRQWPIGSLMEALREDGSKHPQRLFFVEYVLFNGVNDSDDDARRLLKLLEGVRARINLIPHNAFEGSGLGPPSADRVLAFQKIVREGGFRCLLRASRGREISAACGQLALKSA
jgi:23S rRNA (adenine2503-C2)-methyltransferase